MAGTYRLVASDIDGTLLLDWNQAGINPLVFDQIRELRRRGALFLVASGRQIGNLRRLFSPVADQIAYLCNNGSIAIVGDEVILRRPMPRDLALEACHAVMDTPGLDVLISGERTSYALTSAPEFIEHLEVVVGDDVTAVTRPEDIKEEIVKVSYHGEPALMDAVLGSFERRFGERAKVVTSGATWTDLMALGVEKGSSMRMLGERWGIAPEQMVAFGDNFNDAEMLDLVGRPCLMESGKADLRALNDRMRVVKSVHGELADLLATPGVF